MIFYVFILRVYVNSRNVAVWDLGLAFADQKVHLSLSYKKDHALDLIKKKRSCIG